MNNKKIHSAEKEGITKCLEKHLLRRTNEFRKLFKKVALPMNIMVIVLTLFICFEGNSNVK